MYLVVVVDHLAGVYDGELGGEAGHLGLVLRPDEHVLAEVVLPRQLRDDANVLARLGARPAVPIEDVPSKHKGIYIYTYMRVRTDVTTVQRLV